MLHRFVRQILALEPLARADVKGRNLRGTARRFQFGCEQFLEQLVVPEPLRFGVQRDDEEILVAQGPDEARALRGRVRIVAARADRRAKRRAEAVEDRRLEQPVAHLGRLPGDRFVGQVLLRVLDSAPQVMQNGRGILVLPERQRHQAEAGDPPFELLLDLGQRIVGQREPDRRFEQRPRFGGVEPEIAHADLVHLPAGSQQGQGDRRIAPRDDDEVQAAGRPREHLLEELVDRRAGPDAVIVVEHENHRCRQGVQLVAQGGGERADRPTGGRRSQPHGVLARVGEDAANGGGDVGHELPRVAFVRVERQPRSGARTASEPAGNQQALAIAGRGGEERQRKIAPGVQALEQAGAGHEVSRQRRAVQLGLQDERSRRRALDRLAVAGDDGAEDRGAEEALAAQRGPNGVHEVFGRAVLEHVGGGARLEHVVHEALLAVHRQRDDLAARRLGENPGGCLDAAHARHRHVHDHHIGPKRLDPLQSPFAVARLPHDREPGLALEQRTKALPHQGMVVDEEDRRRLRCALGHRASEFYMPLGRLLKSPAGRSGRPGRRDRARS